jgi:FkbM family methyltransferase
MTACTVSLITPSFNQAKYVERMLKSVAMQSLQPIEHIIYDAGSEDGTLDLLRIYAQDRSHVNLEVGRDTGQANAINLGFSQARGDVIAWLNTDDWYSSTDVLSHVSHFFSDNQDVDIWYGRGDFISERGKFLREAFINTEYRTLRSKFISSVGILQPALFMKRQVFEDIGPLVENMSFAFDYEYWVRASFYGKRFFFEDRKVCEATLHSASITMRQRDRSILEAAEVAKKYYGFAPYQWIDRAADAIINNIDGIVDTTRTESSEKSKKVLDIFMDLNSQREHAEKAFSSSHLPATWPTVNFFKQALGLDTARSFVTAFDEKFFNAGLTLISGIHGQQGPGTPIFVYDLGLCQSQRRILKALQNVFVLDFPTRDFDFPEKYLHSSSYGFKTFANWHIKHILSNGDSALWIDAGIYPLRKLDEIFLMIENDHVFLVDHDDKSIWPFFNATFASDDLIKGMAASNDELISPHLRAGIMGYKIGGKFDQMIEEAYKYSLNPSILMGDKNPSPPIFRNRKVGEASNKAVNDREFRNSLSQAQLRELFGYFGHRHDQVIYSVLASRYAAPYHSAKKYCLADSASTSTSKKNWLNGGMTKDLVRSRTVPEFYRLSSAATMQHRGTFINFSGLAFERVTNQRRAVILGNGPSLKGFDFSRLKGLDVFGMNVAYRYWDKIDWYPSYYSCLDTVVGISHKESIARLIETSDENGIRLFLLRENLVKQLGDIKNIHKVLNFDQIRHGYQQFDAPTISTGSHTAAWAAALGYSEIFLLGIDCNYIEIVDGAVLVKGTELEIVEEKPNPNYFFDGYQQTGDKYNIPNPRREIHLESWREVASVLARTPAIILNANFTSKVDAFDFCDFEQVSNQRPVLPIRREAVLCTKREHNSHRSTELIASYARSSQAHLDETDIIAELFSTTELRRTGCMIDVGAHFGTSLAPFLDMGWKIFAFEPDESNRAKLIHRLSTHVNKHLVSLDSRCVSNTSRKGVPFFTSEQSTGISGLSAFHATHRESQAVNTTTLADFFANSDLPEIDFLKVDTEGHDLFVLQGFPWERGKPVVIECEFEDSKTVPLGYSFHDLSRFLFEKGYTVYVSEWHPVVRYGIRHDWRQLKRYPCELAEHAGWGNLLAFRNPIDEEQLVSALKKILKIGNASTGQQSDARLEASTAFSRSTSTVGFSVVPDCHFTAIAPNQWRLVDSDGAARRWVATVGSCGKRAGRTFVGTLRLAADRTMVLNVSLGRHGTTTYEGASKRLVLAPGVQQTVRVCKTFAQAHASLKLQVEVVEIFDGSPSTISIDNLGIGESLESIQARIGGARLDLRTANRSFREGDYFAAMGINFELLKRHSLPMYGDNGVRAARALGLSWVKQVQDLSWLE